MRLAYQQSRLTCLLWPSCLGIAPESWGLGSRFFGQDLTCISKYLCGVGCFADRRGWGWPDLVSEIRRKLRQIASELELKGLARRAAPSLVITPYLACPGSPVQGPRRVSDVQPASRRTVNYSVLLPCSAQDFMQEQIDQNPIFRRFPSGFPYTYPRGLLGSSEELRSTISCLNQCGV